MSIRDGKTSIIRPPLGFEEIKGKEETEYSLYIHVCAWYTQGEPI